MSEERDYRNTVFLPKTDFPMKAGLPQKEPGILARWIADDQYRRLREAREGREKFILHDGPPYANGDIHVGHALNHVLKDMVVRTQTLLGKDAPYVPGWDCHGLPIEWKVEEEYRKKKKNKDEVPAEEFRAECRAYAQKWVDVQREQLKRLGVGGDWDHPYLTMDYAAEATIVAELMKFAESGQLYRGAKPVMWSPVEKTALAEAEVEYEDIVSTQIDVAFEITESPIEDLVGAHAVIWTTTPWTIPVNQAIAYGPEVEYVLLRFDEMAAPYTLLVAMDLAEAFGARIGHPVVYTMGDTQGTVTALKSIMGKDLAGTVARHPMANFFRQSREGDDELEGASDALNIDAASPLAEFFLRPRPFLPGDFVTTESGTGLVHMAPDHGEDDFDLCKAHGLEPVFAVEGDGKYRTDWAWLGGQGSVINPKFNAPDGPICLDLQESGKLLAASADYKHSYPHSWRSKAKVVFRCTPQWFVPMDKEPSVAPAKAGAAGQPGATPEEIPASAGRTLRQTAMQALADTRFVPAKGRNRIGAMVEGRPDWVLSRQRAWGVPITLFVDRKTGQYLADPAVNARIVAAVREGGVDAWTDARAQEYLGNEYSAEDYERVSDILDVWFDSGSTHAFVLESGKWPDLLRPEGYEGPPADLYLEGSDQHRGWFQSSLLESCATRGHAPYKAVLTHGFTMDAKGEKMSKSKGNTVSPLKVMEQYGADIIRLWALSVDYTEDHRIGDEILKGVGDQYRKLRNTFRYLLGALADFDDAERVPVSEMPELERYVLALLGELDAELRQAVDDFEFNDYVRALVEFCNEDLSAFFFDIRKDSLYCDAPTDTKRRAYRTVLDTLFHALVRYAAPVLVFTAEEVWGTRYPDGGSVHLLEWPEVPSVSSTSEDWTALRDLREDVTEAIEPLRRDKVVRSSLQAEVTVPDAGVPSGFSEVDLAELFITGTVRRGQAKTVSVTPTDDAKCGRCWRHLPEVSEDGALCDRCEAVVAEMDATA
ncbi:isoleucine--tRNA ligase [Novosphingobium aquimarinum]|uniref:isoleucine--tRNA ligase n=1 Tax=Novosphingobium aquimarinum TaxID=2682494 RepID=UPI0012EB1F6E|nr:isoleucine--tRNA ligase [Novosphingobium aquimarinum]